MMEQATESAYQIPAGFEWMIEWVCLYIKKSRHFDQKWEFFEILENSQTNTDKLWI